MTSIVTVSDLDKSKRLRRDTILSSELEKYGIRPLDRKKGLE